MRRISGIFLPEPTAVLAGGAFCAVVQTLLVRETLAAVSGNELVIGIMLAVWLAATAAGSILGVRSRPRLDIILAALLVFGFSGMSGVRAMRLLLMPGESPSPHLLIMTLIACEAPVAAAGGWLFGTLAQRNAGGYIYRWEQAGTLFGLTALSAAIAAFAPNFLIAAAATLMVVTALRGVRWRCAGVLISAAFLLSDRTTAAWKYPLTMKRIVYAREGEVGEAVVDGQRITFVNGSLYSTTYTVPSVEQAVHTPLGMHPKLKRVLIINSSGHLKEARKYSGTEINCIRTDRLMDDPSCPCVRPEAAKSLGHFDAVVLGCGMPENAASSRFFTRNFFEKMHLLTGDSGLFSFTLPFNTEYADPQQRLMRDILVSTLKSVYRHVKILPAEGFTFVASDADYTLPDTCRVENEYYLNLILAGLTEERIEAANRPPESRLLHTAARPRLMLAALKRYMERFRIELWMFIALPLFLIVPLLLSVKWSMEAISVGTSGMCAGIYSVAILLLYQSIYGTVYGRLSLLMLALSAGFALGCFVKRFWLSDLWIGLTLGGSLFCLSVFDTPPQWFFFAGNAAAGFLTSAQFVTRRSTPAALLYAADCMGGVIGMSFASTVLIPLLGTATVASAMIAIKAATGVASVWWSAKETGS